LSSEETSSKPDLYVIARIIKVLKEKNRVNRTALATSSGIAYDRLLKYLDWMQKRNFVKEDSDGLISLTKEGTKVYDDLVQWIMKNVGQLTFPRPRPRT
jgi:predicted transcriptional regulator